MNGFDRRVARTRRLLIDALIKLIVEDGYDAVTIRGIVKKADVNRSTFYLHFRDKQDILNYMENEVLSELAAAIRNPNYTYESALWDYKILKRPIQSAIALFEHVEKYASLYRTILVEKDFRARVTQVTSTELFSFLPNELEVAFVSNGIIGLIRVC
ncbi:TetR family transcriptional regulator [Alicyclobacillus acidoterrestris]|uniref:TetR/AcrR family transcriptional regulator n=1 Tax=Alicyclobacillus acidoterrestris TaxID=1450 RepID=UPI003F52B5B4